MVQKTEDLYLTLLGQKAAKEKFSILYTSSFASLQGGGQRSLLLLLKFLDKKHLSRYCSFLKKASFLRKQKIWGSAILCWRFPGPGAYGFGGVSLFSSGY